MTSHQVIVLILIQLAILILPAAGMYKMFEKAGVPGWKAFVPFYNTWIILGLGKRPRHWFFWQFIPIVGWFISMGIFVEFVKTFGKYKLHEHAMAALLPVAYFAYIGFNKQDKFLGAEALKNHKKSTSREWIDAGVFAVVAATLIRTFLFEAYAIPTGSMEKSLLVNDYLFVSKVAYGPRLPNTPLAVPFIHNEMPLTKTKSYVEWIKIPYIRWFASPVKRNEPVVFNLPVNDTSINKEEYGSKDPYYDVIRRAGNGDMDAGRKMILSDPDDYPILIRPVDKRENYVKRCVALPGDTLVIKDQVIYINGKPSGFPPESETFYYVETGGQALDETAMKEEYNVDVTNTEEIQTTGKANTFRMLLTHEAKEKMLKSGLAKSIIPEMDSVFGTNPVFPYDHIHKWTQDEFGPLWMPKKGATLTLTPENYTLYERAIRTYEGNELETRNGKFYINGHETNQYTFKMDYFWMMGDNRHNSLDSRFWGFVPEDHIVGHPALVWMSWNEGVRWNRLMKKIN